MIVILEHFYPNCGVQFSIFHLRVIISTCVMISVQCTMVTHVHMGDFVCMVKVLKSMHTIAKDLCQICYNWKSGWHVYTFQAVGKSTAQLAQTKKARFMQHSTIKQSPWWLVKVSMFSAILLLVAPVRIWSSFSIGSKLVYCAQRSAKEMYLANLWNVWIRLTYPASHHFGIKLSNTGLNGNGSCEESIRINEYFFWQRKQKNNLVYLSLDDPHMFYAITDEKVIQVLSIQHQPHKGRGRWTEEEMSLMHPLLTPQRTWHS